jgi:hypothetical protein
MKLVTSDSLQGVYSGLTTAKTLQKPCKNPAILWRNCRDLLINEGKEVIRG